MIERFIPAIRSFFIAPANRADLVNKFPRFNADCYIIDLEDGTPPPAKESARAMLGELVRELRASEFSHQLGVRVNEPWSSHYLRDIEAAWSADIDFVVIPKLETSEHLFPVLHGLSFTGNTASRKRWVMGGIESMRGVSNVDHLVAAAPELASVYFGGEDYATELGAIRTRAAREIFYARSRVVHHARQAGLNVIDQGITDFRDDEWFREDALEGRRMGYNGKICLLPRQVAIANEVFAPATAELEHAQRVVEAYRGAMERGMGTLDFEGQMIDGPLFKRALAVLAKAR